MKILTYMKYKLALKLGIVMVFSCTLLTACQEITMVERNDAGKVIQEEFTQSAIALTNELDDYIEIDELFIEDEIDNALNFKIRQFLERDEEIAAHHLNLEAMDLKIFTSEEGKVFFLAVLRDNRERPNTMFGVLEEKQKGEFAIIGEHLAAYVVNLPKTYLLEKEGEWALVSQRPFSTFEECYFFKIDTQKLSLYKRGWRDPSLNYYGMVTDLLNQGKINEAIELPDESMYPMGYEEPLFTTANLMIKVSEAKALEMEKANNVEQALYYLEWSLNYYFENHYGADLLTMFQDNFKEIKEGSADDFGGKYCLDNKELTLVLRHYANLIAKTGLEKEATGYQKAIDKFNK